MWTNTPWRFVTSTSVDTSVGTPGPGPSLSSGGGMFTFRHEKSGNVIDCRYGMIGAGIGVSALPFGILGATRETPSGGIRLPFRGHRTGEVATPCGSDLRPDEFQGPFSLVVAGASYGIVPGSQGDISASICYLLFGQPAFVPFGTLFSRGAVCFWARAFGISVGGDITAYQGYMDLE
jgi:hypothetical protein